MATQLAKNSPYSASFTAAALMHGEMNAVLPYLLKDGSEETIKLIENSVEILPIKSAAGRYRITHEMVKRFAERRVKISLPSQRIDTVLTDTLKETQKVRKTALTLAPEAGTQRLRDVINKGVTEEDLVRSVTDAFQQGWSAVKLYFMIGLPTETDEDVLGIAHLADVVRRCYFSVPKERRAPAGQKV